MSIQYILSIVFGALLWIMLCWSVIEHTNFRAKIDTVLFFGGVVTIAVLDLNTSTHTTAFFSAVISTAIVIRAISYFKFEVSRDIVATAQSAWSTVKAHPLACLAFLFGIWTFFDSTFTVLG